MAVMEKTCCIKAQRLCLFTMAFSHSHGFEEKKAMVLAHASKKGGTSSRQPEEEEEDYFKQSEQWRCSSQRTLPAIATATQA